jgi:hypothetical protein
VVTGQQADAHLGKDLQDALLQRLLQVLLSVCHANVWHLEITSNDVCQSLQKHRHSHCRLKNWLGIAGQQM